MAKFCQNCGRPLKDDEICNCTETENSQNQNTEQKTENTSNTEQTVHTDTNDTKQTLHTDITSLEESLNKVSNAIGKGLDKIYYLVTPKDLGRNKRSNLAIRKLLSFSQEDYIKPFNNVYERGTSITPDLIEACNEEVPVKQYELCNARSLLRGLWQDGRLLITNKRVLFRLSGRSWLGKEQSSKEFAINDIAGVDMTYNTKFSLIAGLINALLMFIPSLLGIGCSFLLPTLSVLLGMICYLFFIFCLKGHYIFKNIIFTFAFCLMLNAEEAFGRFGIYIGVIGGIISLIYFYRASLRPNFAFKILTNCESVAPISASRVNILEHLFLNEILPGKDAEKAMSELGAMIYDIQKYGEDGVNKWKSK